jgi:hypothetical protein
MGHSYFRQAIQAEPTLIIINLDVRYLQIAFYADRKAKFYEFIFRNLGRPPRRG